MVANAILLPVLGMVLVTFLVCLRMYIVRLGEMRTRRIHPQKVSTRAAASTMLTNTGASDNLMNLFEMPVLFYVAALTVFAIGATDGLYIGLAWAYVGLRALHSLIHTTYNRVMHRFAVYMASIVVLLAMWIKLAVDILARG